MIQVQGLTKRYRDRAKALLPLFAGVAAPSKSSR